ncbi:hypothetical protein NQ314_001102 [Rhamnusium bicolor]|uniref:Uncharacterized protein n=1 Tax=Rhamnusium bicolor TaxID=1586634 RepID=A0AAV8ZU31_9CUCU|nr:hypothetical protein NQ314_001102 [Rhamnusium bicolor]
MLYYSIVLYFWRPWTAGSPPSDAITGRDYRGVSYIVEAYAPDYGLFIGQALTNQQQVNISALHVLCSQNKDKLAWFPINYNSVVNQVLTGTINPVVGGLNVKDDILYIGRYVDVNLGTVHFGSICQEYHHLHYYHNNKVYTQSYYEILIVDGRCTQKRLKLETIDFNG